MRRQHLRGSGSCRSGKESPLQGRRAQSIFHPRALLRGAILPREGRSVSSYRLDLCCSTTSSITSLLPANSRSTFSRVRRAETSRSAQAPKVETRHPNPCPKSQSLKWRRMEAPRETWKNTKKNTTTTTKKKKKKRSRRRVQPFHPSVHRETLGRRLNQRHRHRLLLRPLVGRSSPLVRSQGSTLTEA